MLTKIFIILYPILAFLILAFIFKLFRLRKLTKQRLKIPDILVIFLVIGLQIFSEKVASNSILPYYLLLISGLALVLLLLDLFYYQEFAWRKFLKLWWRLSFFITLLIYIGMAVLLLIR